MTLIKACPFRHSSWWALSREFKGFDWKPPCRARSRVAELFTIHVPFFGAWLYHEVQSFGMPPGGAHGKLWTSQGGPPD